MKRLFDLKYLFLPVIVIFLQSEMTKDFAQEEHHHDLVADTSDTIIYTDQPEVCLP